MHANSALSLQVGTHPLWFSTSEQNKTIQIYILGPFEMTDESIYLRIPGEKLKTLIAVLSLTPNQPVSKSRLIDELWPEGEEPRNAKNSLQGHVARLRRILAERSGRGGARKIIETSDYGYKLALAPHNIDSWRFYDLVSHAERIHKADPQGAIGLLTGALELWRGPPLLDTGQGTICRMAYTHLAETKIQVFEALFDAKLRLDLHRTVIAEVEQLHAQYPLRERFCEQLMIALYRSGRQADALDVYHKTRQRLSHDLGLEPGRALRATFQGVLQQDSKLFVSERCEPVRPRSSAYCNDSS
jgi:DNA-binding SARP family transcriptional activator